MGERDAADSRYLLFRAGPVGGKFDKVTGGLRDICWGGRCIWRGLVVLVRGPGWKTVPTRIARLESHIGEDRFRIAFEAMSMLGEIDFRWRGTIEGEAFGWIRYVFDGKAAAEFDVNRIGFCVLHPCELYAGGKIRQLRVGGEVVEGHFPELVEPQVLGRFSIRDLEGIDHEVQPGVWGEARFEGEVFETEDQRNWSDASFKTYCTPLERPIPVRLRPGDSRRQAVELRLVGYERSESNAPARPCVVVPAGGSGSRALPSFGMNLPPPGRPLPESLESLTGLGIDFARLDLAIGVGPPKSWLPRLLHAADIAGRASAKLELALYLPPGGAAALNEPAAAIGELRASIARVIVYRRGEPVTLREDLRAIRGVLGDIDVPIGGGSDANFCELNRERALKKFPVDECDFVCWAANPQVHAFDEASILETPLSVEGVVATARSFAPGKPLFVTPLTLLPRPHAGVVADAWPTPPVDPRQSGRLTADWSIAMWQALAAAGVAGTTWFEAFGPRGFAAYDGVLTPAAERFAAIAAERRS